MSDIYEVTVIVNPDSDESKIFSWDFFNDIDAAKSYAVSTAALMPSKVQISIAHADYEGFVDDLFETDSGIGSKAKILNLKGV